MNRNHFISSMNNLIILFYYAKIPLRLLFPLWSWAQQNRNINRLVNTLSLCHLRDRRHYVQIDWLMFGLMPMSCCRCKVLVRDALGVKPHICPGFYFKQPVSSGCCFWDLVVKCIGTEYVQYTAHITTALKSQASRGISDHLIYSYHSYIS